MTLFLLLLLGVFGPLLAMKAGLAALEKTRDWITVEAVSQSFSPSVLDDRANWRARAWALVREIPILPLSAGFAGAWLAACALGLAAHLSGGLQDGSLGGFWTAWAYAAPMVLAAALLYFPELRACGKKTVLTRDKIAVFVSALGLTVIWGAVFGLALLVHAFYLLDRRRDCPDCDKAKNEPWTDPKPWLLLGLLSLCELNVMLVQSGGARRVVFGGICGAALGCGLIFVRLGLCAFFRSKKQAAA